MSSMPQDNSETLATPASITVGQLVYTSFKKFGFKMLTSPNTPYFIQQSFVDKIVNARWDPHSPPSPDFRGAYVYQSLEKYRYTVFGWLYYDGQDDFGRSGVPYFLAYYQLGPIFAKHLDVFLNCIQNGPESAVSRQLQDQETLQRITLNPSMTYNAARLGVNVPSDLRTKCQKALEKEQPIDWFMTQNSANDAAQADVVVHETPVPEIIFAESTDSSETAHTAIQLVETPLQKPQLQRQSPPSESAIVASESPIVPKRALLSSERVESILQDFVNRTMGIYGIALISPEGQPIVSAMGLDENVISKIAGLMLKMDDVARQDLDWSSCDWITLRGPDHCLMLRAFEPGIYLLIKSAKVPMSLLEGVVKRMSSKLKAELSEFKTELIAVWQDEALILSDETMVQASDSMDSTPFVDEIPELLRSVLGKEASTGILDPNMLDEEAVDFDEDITYRGRPTSS